MQFPSTSSNYNLIVCNLEIWFYVRRLDDNYMHTKKSAFCDLVNFQLQNTEAYMSENQGITKILNEEPNMANSRSIIHNAP